MGTRGLWLDPVNVEAGESIGSLLMVGDLSTDEHGMPFQVLLRSQDDELVGVVTDADGWPLAWLHDADGEVVHGPDGRAALQRVPDDVAEAARGWFREQSEAD